MYRLMVLYPNGADKHFDVDYYRDKHMPMVEGFIGADMIRTEISWGTADLNGAEAPYMCIGTLYMKIMAGYENHGRTGFSLRQSYGRYGERHPELHQH